MITDSSWSLFLDRDGVINQHPSNHYVMRWEEFEFVPGVITALQALRPLFQRIIIVTNQQGVGKGLMKKSDIDDIHERMNEEIE